MSRELKDAFVFLLRIIAPRRAGCQAILQLLEFIIADISRKRRIFFDKTQEFRYNPCRWAKAFIATDRGFLPAAKGAFFCYFKAAPEAGQIEGS